MCAKQWTATIFVSRLCVVYSNFCEFEYENKSLVLFMHHKTMNRTVIKLKKLNFRTLLSGFQDIQNDHLSMARTYRSLLVLFDSQL